MRAIRAAVLAAIAVGLASGAPVRALLIDEPEWQPQTATVKSILIRVQVHESSFPARD
jgi:hypothetical protein